MTRAGTATPFWWGTSISTDQANYDGAYLYEGGRQSGIQRKKTLPVQSFEVNPWGLYQFMEMSGSGWKIVGMWSAAAHGTMRLFIYAQRLA